MDVQIIDQVTDEVVATYPVNLQAEAFDPDEDDYFAQAWLMAVEDGVVEPETQEDYRFDFRH